MRELLMAVLAVLLAAGSAPAALAQPREVSAPADPWVHAATGTAFPAAIDDFRRGRVIEYNADGSDASASYDLIAGGNKMATATVYVYPPPAGENCAAAWEATKAMAARGQSRLLSEGAAPPFAFGSKAKGHHAAYELVANLGGTTGLLRSEALLYCVPGGKWLVKVRASWPASIDASAQIAALVGAIGWPEALTR